MATYKVESVGWLAWLVPCKYHLKAASQLHAHVCMLEGRAVCSWHGVALRGLKLLLRELSVESPVECDQDCHKVLQKDRKGLMQVETLILRSLAAKSSS